MPQVTLKKQNEVVIAATSDLHGCLEGIRQVCDDNKVDILIIAGDIQPADIQYHCNDTACGRWFRNKFFNLIKKLKCEVVAIPGNHDFWLRSFIHGNFGTPEERKEKFFIPDNFHLLAESEVTIKGLRIYGTPWVPWISGHWCFEAEEKELVWKWKQIPEGIDILVTHTPPRYDNHKKPPEEDAESLVRHRNRAGIDTASEKMVYYEQEEPVPEVAKALCEEKTDQDATGYDTRHRPKGTLAAGLGQRPNRRGESLRQASASSARKQLTTVWQLYHRI